MTLLPEHKILLLWLKVIPIFSDDASLWVTLSLPPFLHNRADYQLNQTNPNKTKQNKTKQNKPNQIQTNQN